MSQYPQDAQRPEGAAQSSVTPGAVPPNPAPVPEPVEGQLPMPSTPMPQVELPVADGAYHQFWRTPLWRWWRPVAALLVGALIFVGITILASSLAIGIDVATGRRTVEEVRNASQGNVTATPALFLINNLSLAALIPVGMLLGRWFFRQPGGWLSSITGRLRWGWLGRCFAVLLPLWVVYIGAETWLQARSPEGLGLAVNRDTWLLVVGILLTTPFQAAGEEYGFRGVITRALASFFGHRWVGLAAGAVVSSVLFMLSHFADDPWLNLFYFCFGLIACAMTLRTGGLEASIAMHVVNNVLSEATMPFSDISGIFDRQVGAGDPTVLIGILVPLIGWALVEWQARCHQIVRTAAPGLERQRQLEQQLATWQQQMIAWQRHQQH
ncbi:MULTISPECIES: CPBP family intramembrane glutamic endopeptidase [unclassified Luteococcus]|uniref:CPBP family intramembrane glutamic endopeptidase n=1 Tax=unclassified Luteococcus TaxID=2639923 RepID=UPI00313BF73E